jgi:hypothetical protein
MTDQSIEETRNHKCHLPDSEDVNPLKGRSDRDNEGPTDPRSGALIGVIVILVLAILAVMLVRDLGKQSKIQDCLMSGRTNCTPIEVPSRE